MSPGDVWRFGVASTLAAGIALVIVQRDRLDGNTLRLLMEQAGAWAPLAFVAVYALATVLFLPGSVLTLAAGALFGPLAGALYSLAGATIGASAAFLVARHLAGNWAARRAGPRLGELIEGVEGEGWRFVAFLRLMPLFPFNLVNYALGLTRTPLRAYVLASGVCMLPGAVAYAWLGHAGREALAGGENAIRAGLVALALLAVVMFLPRLVRRLRGAALITPEQLRRLLNEGSAALVDVRDASEFHGQAGHVAGARNLPLAQLEVRMAELEPWRSGGVILICNTDRRSNAAARQLARSGFMGLRVVRGGMQAWLRLDYPRVVTEAAVRAGHELDPRA